MKFPVTLLLPMISFANFKIVSGNNIYPKYTDDFCENEGYWISKNEYSNEWIEIVCAEIGKVPVIIDQNNFNHVGFSLAICNGENSNAWIDSLEKYNCFIYNAESYYCGSIISADCYENQFPVICQ